MEEAMEVARGAIGAPDVGKKPRKKRYTFQEGDDVHLFRAVLDIRRGGEYIIPWRDVADGLKAKGILANRESLRMRLHRLTETHRTEMAQGCHAMTSNPDNERLRLMTEYCELLAAEEGAQEMVQQLKKRVKQKAEIETKEAVTKQERRIRRRLGSIPKRTASAPAPTTDRKPPLDFTDEQDVLLLQTVLGDATKPRKRTMATWSAIEDSLNRLGVAGDVETFRGRLKDISRLYSQEEAAGLLESPASQKQKLLAVYCKRLDSSNSNESDESNESSTLTIDRPRGGGKRPRPGESAAKSPVKLPRKTLENILERFTAEQNARRREELDHQRLIFRAQQEFQHQTMQVLRQTVETQTQLMRVLEKLAQKLE